MLPPSIATCPKDAKWETIEWEVVNKQADNTDDSHGNNYSSAALNSEN